MACQISGRWHESPLDQNDLREAKKLDGHLLKKIYDITEDAEQDCWLLPQKTPSPYYV